MINAAEMASLRAPENQAFGARAVVLRKTQVADTSGGFTDSYASTATYDCSFAKMPIRAREIEQGQRVILVSLWSFVFAASVDIRATDRLLVGTRTFEVVDAGIGNNDIVLKATCTEIT